MGMGHSGGPGGPSSLSEINITPLVDVMLVLLIIFMVAATVETVRVERELEKSARVERDLVPRKPEPPKDVLKDVPVVVPNTQVKKVQETEQKEPKVVLDQNLVFRLDKTPIVDCRALWPVLAGPMDATDEAKDKAFAACAQSAAEKLGPNVLLQEKKRVNFAADQNIPWGWATKFMAVMGAEHGIKQVNIIARGPQQAETDEP